MFLQPTMLKAFSINMEKRLGMKYKIKVILKVWLE